MFKFEFIPKDVCALQMTYYINANEVYDLQIKGGCPGDSQALAAAARTIKDIDLIINTFGLIACHQSKTKKTLCAQQQAYGLLLYKKVIKDQEIIPEQKQMILSITKVENIIEFEETLEKNTKNLIKRNIKQDF